MTTAQTVHDAFTTATELSKKLAAIQAEYGVFPQLTITPAAVLVAVPWNIGRQDMREALAGDIAQLLGTELAVTGSTDEDDEWIGLTTIGQLDGTTVHVVLTFPPAPATT